MACSTLRMKIIDEIKGEPKEYLGSPFIVSTSDGLIMYNFRGSIQKDLYYLSFNDWTWQRIIHNLPSLLNVYSIMMLGERFMVIHTRSRPSSTHRTYIADVTQRPMQFRCIGMDRPPMYTDDYVHRIVSDGTFLYLLLGHCDVPAIQHTSVFRLNTTNTKWTEISPCNNAIVRPIDSFDLTSRYAAHFDSKLYVFPDTTNPIYTDFTIINEFDIRSNAWHTRDLLPHFGNHGPLGYPRIQDLADEASIAQCPVESRYLYVMVGHIMPNQPEWDIWRLDLVALQWCRLQVYGPPAASLGRTSITITPFGMLCGMRMNYAYISGLRSLPGDPDPLPEGSCMFYAWIRVPRLADLCKLALAHNPAIRDH